MSVTPLLLLHPTGFLSFSESPVSTLLLVKNVTKNALKREKEKSIEKELDLTETMLVDVLICKERT
jgi:hypothetical protein